MAATNTLVYTRIPRFDVQGAYDVLYMDMLDTGLLAVAGGRISNNSKLFTNLFKFDLVPDSQETPLLAAEPYFSKEFTEFDSVWQSVRLLDDRLFLMCFKEKIALYDINNGGQAKTETLDGVASCMTTRDGLVYVGLRCLKVIVLDARELETKKTITLTGLKDNWPQDIAVSNDKLFICTGRYGRAFMCNSEGEIEQEYKNTQYRYADSITVSEKKGLIFILWIASSVADVNVDSQVVVYSLSWPHSLASFNVPHNSKRIRINNNINRLILVTGKTGITGNFYEYHTLQSYIFTFDNLLKFVESLTVKNHCLELIEHCEVPAIESWDIIQSNAPFTKLIHHLRGARTVCVDDISHLMKACSDKELRKLRAVKQLTQLTQNVFKDQLKASENTRHELSHKLTKSENENQQLRDELKTLKASPTKPHPPWRISLAYGQSTFQYLSDIFTFDKLLKLVEPLTEKDHYLELIEYFEVPAEESRVIIESNAPFTTLIHHLRGARTVSDDDISHLMKACSDKELRKLRAVKQLTQLTLDVFKDQLKALKSRRYELSHKLAKSEKENQQLKNKLKTLKALLRRENA